MQKYITALGKKPISYGNMFFFSLIFLVGIKHILLFSTYSGALLMNDIVLSFSSYAGFLLADSFLLFLCLLLVSVGSLVSSRVFRIGFLFLSFLLVAVFSLDTIILYVFQSRLSLPDIYQFVINGNNSFFTTYALLGIVGLFVFMGVVLIFSQIFLPHTYKKKTLLILVGIACVGTITSYIGARQTAKNLPLYKDVISHWASSFERTNDFSSLFTGKSYESFFSLQPGQNKHPNIILVFAESFSAIDSQKNGGIVNNFPLFDTMQTRGVSYPNFLANGCTSETSHIAVLQGIEAWEHPSMSKENAYSEYTSLHDPLPIFLEKNGYTTTFLSTVTLDFLHQKDFLKKMGFMNILGNEIFSGDSSYTFGAAPDEILYQKAEQIVKEKTSPYFLAMQTISSHEPYATPYGKSEKSARKYVDDSIYGFYQQLKKNHFFDNGILIVISDHRKMFPVTPKEKAVFGNTAPSRVIGTIIGSGVTPGSVIQYPVQHIDFFYSLRKLISKNPVMTRSLYNDVFGGHTGRDRAVRYCRYYVGDSGYVVMKGKKSGYRLGAYSGNNVNEYIQSYKKYQYDHWKQYGKNNASEYLSGSFTENLLLGN